MNRYACTLLFQFRRTDRATRRRLCEDRIFEVLAKDEEDAYSKSIRIGKREETDFRYDNYTEFYEFVGVTQLVELSTEDDGDEIWHRYREMVRPLERRATLVPAKEKLDVFARHKRLRSARE